MSNHVRPPRLLEEVLSATIEANGSHRIKNLSEVGQIKDATSASLAETQFEDAAQSPFSLRSHPGPLVLKKLRIRWMIVPHSPYRLLWDLFITILLLYCTVIIPFRFAFRVEDTCTGDRLAEPLFWWDTFVDFSFLADVVMQFRTGIYIIDKGSKQAEINMDPTFVAVRYIKSWAIIDLLGSIPIDLVAWTVCLNGANRLLRIPRTLKVLRIARILRLVRLSRVSSLSQKGLDTLHLNPIVIKISKLLLQLFLMIHFLACGFWAAAMAAQDAGTLTWAHRRSIPFSSGMVAASNQTGNTAANFVPLVNADVAHQYLFSVYWATATVTTTGYGDITPTNAREAAYAIAGIVVGAFMFAFGVSSVADMIPKIDMRANDFRAHMAEVEEFFGREQIPPRLRRRVRQYLEKKFKDRMQELPPFLSELNSSLRSKVAMSLYGHMLNRWPLIKGADESLLSSLVLKMKPMKAAPGEYLFKQGDTGTFMLFIARGCAEVIVDGKVFLVLREGDHVGERAAFGVSSRRQTSVRAKEWCDLFALHRADVRELLKKNRHWNSALLQRIRAQRWKRVGRLQLFMQHGSADGSLMNSVVLTSKDLKPQSNRPELAGRNLSEYSGPDLLGAANSLLRACQSRKDSPDL